MVSDIPIEERHRLNRLVAETVGFTLRQWPIDCWAIQPPAGCDDVYPPAVRQDMAWRLGPDFTRDMNACHKWLLPWLGRTLREQNRDDRWRIQYSPWDDGVVVVAERIAGEPVREEGPLADLPLLLCRLVERIEANG